MAEYVNFFIALFIIANPFAGLPVFLQVTAHESFEQKRKTAVRSAIYIALILFSTAYIGEYILSGLGIKVDAFRITGGIILLSLGLSMLNAEEPKLKRNEEVEARATTSKTHAIVPLATPLIAGPGAISTIIIATTANGFSMIHSLVIGLIGCAVAAAIGLIWFYASSLEKAIGPSGINIFTRIGGLILTAMSIQAICTGLLGFFPALGL